MRAASRIVASLATLVLIVGCGDDAPPVIGEVYDQSEAGHPEISLIGAWKGQINAGPNPPYLCQYSFGRDGTFRVDIFAMDGSPLETGGGNARLEDDRLHIAWATGNVEESSIQFLDHDRFHYQVLSHSKWPEKVGLTVDFRRVADAPPETPVPARVQAPPIVQAPPPRRQPPPIVQAPAPPQVQPRTYREWYAMQPSWVIDHTNDLRADLRNSLIARGPAGWAELRRKAEAFGSLMDRSNRGIDKANELFNKPY